MLLITAQLKRVLKKSGAFYMNFGDTYGGSWQDYGTRESLQRTKNTESWKRGDSVTSLPPSAGVSKNYAKSLLCVPERLVIAMVDNQGWTLRNKIIWKKKNCMPSSTKDRFSNTWEYLFFLTKSKKYWFDLDAVRVPHVASSIARIKAGFDGRPGGTYFNYRVRDAQKKSGYCPQFKATPEEIAKYKKPQTKIPSKDAQLFNSPRARVHRSKDVIRTPRKNDGTGYGTDGKGIRDHKGNSLNHPSGKNPGDTVDYWEIATQPFGDEFCPQCERFIEYNQWIIIDKELCCPCKSRLIIHFATFPEALVKSPILSSCPEWICKKCGKARVRITKPTEEYAKNLGEKLGNHKDCLIKGQGRLDTKGHRVTAEYKTTGWTDCGCGKGFRAGTAMDPFAGKGTVSLVAERLGRNSIAIELNSDYAKMIRLKLKQETVQNKLFDQKVTVEFIKIK